MTGENARPSLSPPRIGEGEVARILALISVPKNLRDLPGPGDLVGDFDAWFDGGALKYETGATSYWFTDGACAVVYMLPELSVLLTLQGGKRVKIIQ